MGLIVIAKIRSPERPAHAATGRALVMLIFLSLLCQLEKTDFLSSFSGSVERYSLQMLERLEVPTAEDLDREKASSRSSSSSKKRNEKSDKGGADDEDTLI